MLKTIEKIIKKSSEKGIKIKELCIDSKSFDSMKESFGFEDNADYFNYFVETGIVKITKDK